MKTKISITLDEQALKQVDAIVDHIFIRNRSQAIEYLVNKGVGENKTAVILAGGSADKLRLQEGVYVIDATIGKLTLLEHAIKKLRENNFKNIFIVAQHIILTKAFEILKEGASYGVTIHYIEEKTTKGSAESLQLLKGKVKGKFLVVYADLYFEKINLDALWQDHLKQGGLATLMMTTSNTPHAKGILKVEGTKILEFNQKPEKSDIYLVFSPIFVAEEELMDQTGASLEEEVFPKLSKRGLLFGHLSSEKEIHVHTMQDVQEIN